MRWEVAVVKRQEVVMLLPATEQTQDLFGCSPRPRRPQADHPLRRCSFARHSYAGRLVSLLQSGQCRVPVRMGRCASVNEVILAVVLAFQRRCMARA